MKQEFLTVRGKLCIENDHLVIKNIKPNVNDRTYYFVAWVSVLLLISQNDLKGQGLASALLVVFGVVFLVLVLRSIFFKEWKNRLNINDIRSYKLEHDDYGLETTVFLRFKSGREKEIVFRTNENQYEPFLEMLTHNITQPQPV